MAAVRESGGGLAARMRWVIPAVRTAAIVLLALCLARPVLVNEKTTVFTEGVALELVVDRSGSMQALDFTVNDRPVDRLQAVKHVVRDFVEGSGSMEGRGSDLVGLVTFARHADSLSPLTLDHDYTLATLDASRIAHDPGEDGTAIGDAVALGVERLRDAVQGSTVDGRSPIRSAAIILLTDGENNAGDIEPSDAAEMAAAYGVKLYTIGVGTRGTAPMPVQMGSRTILQRVPVNIDEELLTAMADRTGGKYFRATDTDALERIYKEIDALEKSRTESQRTMHYRDLAVQPFRMGGLELPPFLLAAGALVALELVLSSTRFRSIP